MASSRYHATLFDATLALLACTFNAGRADADALAVVDPLPVPGPYAVGCSNVAQDFTRLQPGENAQDYWEGTPDGSRARYVTQLLSDPADALLYNVNVPDDRELFDNHATQQVAYLLLVCYPTTADNPRAGYPAADGRRRAAYATGGRRAIVGRRCGTLAAVAVFARARRQSDFGPLCRASRNTRQLRLCRRRAVSR